MTAKTRKKKLLLFAAAVILIAAAGGGIWFATRGSGEPVNVYPFQHIGMTEFWGDAQESYGPVTTDKIQTAFLSDTQTVTEVAVKSGDSVKKGDVLFSFDTTLDALSLEKKRLEVEKIKVQIKAAEERLEEVRKLDPYVPVPSGTDENEKVDLGEQLKDKPYKISEKTVYDGSKKEKALICWLKDDTAISDAILQELYKTSLEYRQKNAEKEAEKKETSSASAVPNTERVENFSEDKQQSFSRLLAPPKIRLYPFYNEIALEAYDIELQQVNAGESAVKKYIVPDVYSFVDGEEKTCWLVSAIRKSDNAELTELEISECPGDDAGRKEWEALWGEGIKVEYTRKVTFDGKNVKDKQLVSFKQNETVPLKVGQDAVLVFSSQIHDLPKETKLTYTIRREDNHTDEIFVATQDGNDFYLMGKPESLTTTDVRYIVTAEYAFSNSSWLVREEFPFFVSVIPERQKGEYYVVFKTTKDNYLKGVPTTWHGSKVTVYEDGSFELLPFDATGFADHTLPPPENIEIELPNLQPNEIYTEEQLLDMKKQLYATIKEQKEKLKLAETEYDVMSREMGDGNVYAEIDGKVISLLTEEEARQNKQPMVKVSGGGGFYIEGSVSELEKASLKIGQEVTVNDWNTGNMYTGEVVSISDFPTDQDNWNGMGNPTAAYYPYKAFVSEEADLEAGSYVSMSYSASAAEQGIYLEKPFVRTEKGESYIYVRGDDGKLEKRTVKVGKVLWGSYYEILSDLSEEDYLAFPYGKNVKQGAPTVESDLSILYSY